MSGSELGTRPAMGCSPGTVLSSRYTLERRIGTGGYSEVWAGHDAVLDRPVAVKLLHAEHARHEETLQRFRSEAQLSAQLSDANIARVYDFRDASDGPPYLVMEFVDGPTLAQILRTGPLTAARTMDIIAQAAAGLQAAHAAGLVHRDIKPSNIMVAPGNVVKITDFGLSHTLESAPITRTGMVAGTPGYMAPERSAGVRATGAADLYALGVVGYECLTGAPPFAGTPIEVALAHRDYQFPALPAGTPAPVAALIGDLTAKDPASRPASAGAVAGATARLRDTLLAGGGWSNSGPGPAATRLATPPPAGPDGADHRTLVAPGPDAWPAHLTARPAAGPARRGPSAAVGWVLAATLGLAAVIAIVIAALAHKPATPAASTPPPTHAPSPSPQAVRALDVSRASLIGELFGQAASQLRGEGFRVRFQFQRTDAQPPGTVLNVRPAGMRPAGSLITLVVALRDHGHHGKGNGNGNGNGNGGGDGGGND
jgi:eukaryotic-like serine/threonine-protein kinase